jgi:hypothetical protein
MDTRFHISTGLPEACARLAFTALQQAAKSLLQSPVLGRAAWQASYYMGFFIEKALHLAIIVLICALH